VSDTPSTCAGAMNSVGTVAMDSGAREEDGVSRQKWPVGLAEMAEMFGVDKNTPTRWLYRSRKGLMDPRLPEPDGHVSATVPFWWDVTIERWASASRRRLLRFPVDGQMVDVEPEKPADEMVVAGPEFREPISDGHRERVPAGFAPYAG
jgi:hypothetical protein